MHLLCLVEVNAKWCPNASHGAALFPNRLQIPGRLLEVTGTDLVIERHRILCNNLLVIFNVLGETKCCMSVTLVICQ